MEVLVREYDSRLLIALMAIERGMEVIIGQKWLMERNIKFMPPGLWIFKTMTLRDAGVMQKARAAGHAITSIDEEVPGMAEGSADLLWVSEQAVSNCDKIFCVGSEHAKSLTLKWPSHAHRLSVTGNPRWDYLRPELSGIYAEQATRLNAEYGKIILVNTNIGETNSAKYRNEKDATKRYIARGKLDLSVKTSKEMWDDYLDFERFNFNAVVTLVPALASRFPGHTIIVRPHPAEDIETYRKLYSGNDRIKVLFEGPAAAWITASDVLIHTGCTTGTEAFALGKPAISYEPKPSRWHTIMLAGQLNIKASEEGVLLDIVEQLLGDGELWNNFMEAKKNVFSRFFHSGANSLAAENIVQQCLDIIAEKGLSTKTTYSSWRARFGYLPWWFISRNNQRLFPTQKAGAVETKIRSIARFLNKAVEPNVTRIGDRMFKVSRSRK
jgi:surface carbohydrate biosynthesis protein